LNVRFVHAWAATIWAVACGGGDPTTVADARGLPYIAVIDGVPSDTVASLGALPLILEVRDAQGRPVPGAIVRVDGKSDDQGWPIIGLLPEPAQSRGFTQLSFTTNNRGRVGFFLRFGTTAGDGSLGLRVTELDINSRYAVETLPGNQYGFRSTAPEVTYLGTETEILFESIDRFGNARGDETAVEVLTPEILDLVDGTLTGLDFGIGKLRASTQFIQSMVDVVVAPPGELTVFRSSSATAGEQSGIVTIEIDGSRLWVGMGLPETFEPTAYTYPHWSPDGEFSVYSGGPNAGVQDLYIHGGDLGEPRTVNRPGATRMLTPGLEQATIGWVESATFAPDGVNVYFAARETTGGIVRGLDIWRFNRLDWTIELIGPEDGTSLWEAWPHVSPNGQTLVYSLDRGVDLIRLYDLESQLVTPIDVPGIAPRWAPDGSTIAFIRDDGLYRMNPDGSGVRSIVLGDLYEPVLDWSPDGRWIAVTRFQSRERCDCLSPGRLIEIIEVETGLILSLPHTFWWSMSSWRPN
jgi:WD40-like Beta Propeller Repeat